MNAKQAKRMKAHDAKDAEIEAENRLDAVRLRDGLVPVIMRDKYLAAEIALRWARKQGYYFIPKMQADADFRRRFPELVREVKRIKAGSKRRAA
jgi:diketogulonate reductase-like aldo/keto reductase